MGATDLGFHIWLTFRVLLIALLFAYVLCGLDDLLVDIASGLRTLYRRLFTSQTIKPLTRELLDSVPEKPIALMVPAWNASPVIARMLLNTASTVLYKNYHIFVGTYPNDEATKTEVEKVREVFTHIEAVVTPSQGPTNKADCLNWLYQGILLFEKQHHIQFAACVFHNPEDVVHPLSLKYYNYLIPRVHFVQIPAFPFEREGPAFTSGCQADACADAYARDMRIRSLLPVCIPATAAGTALSRESLVHLASRRKNQIFDLSAQNEDYMMGQLLADLPGRKIFLQQSLARTMQRPHPVSGRLREVAVQDPVATRTTAADTFGAAIRQKAAWIRSLFRQAWSRAPGLNYCLYRDRKSVLTSFLLVAGCAVLLYAACAQLVGRLDPNRATPPLLTREDPFSGVLVLASALLAWRVLSRMCAVKAIYNGPQAFLALPRLLWGSLLDVCAAVRAAARGLRAAIRGRGAEWDAPAQAYPSEEQLRRFHRKLGDLLLDRRLITTAQLESAVTRQKETGQKLGDILVRMGALWEEDLVHTLAQQRNEQAVELDPHATPIELLKRVSRKLALQHRVYPLGLEGSTLLLATDAQQRDGLKPLLEAALNCPVRLLWTSGADIEFAISRGYRRLELGAAAALDPAADRLGQRLVRQGLLTEEDLHRALRQQKRSGKKLGEVVLEMKLVSHENLNEELDP